MPFSIEDKALTKTLHHFKKYGSREIVTEFSKINCNREELNTLLKIGKHEAPTMAREWQTKARIY